MLKITKAEKKFLRATEARLGKKFTKKQRKFLVMHERMHEAMREALDRYPAAVARANERMGTLFATGNRPEDGVGRIGDHLFDLKKPPLLVLDDTTVASWLRTLRDERKSPKVDAFAKFLESNYKPTDPMTAKMFTDVFHAFKRDNPAIYNHMHPDYVSPMDWAYPQYASPEVRQKVNKLLENEENAHSFGPGKSAEIVLDCPTVEGLGDVPMPDAPKPRAKRKVTPRIPRRIIKKDDGPTGA